jgi:hypothetical protein
MPAWSTNNTSAEFGTGTTPTPVTRANPAPSGLTYEGAQRLSGGYAPGTMGRLGDELSAGSDDAPGGEE